jgi:tetratricopeptide (TPR) repeat protein
LLLARQAVDEIYTPVADQLAMVPYMQTYQRDVLQKTLRFYQEFAKRNSNDPVIRLETAYASYRVAEIQSSLGQPGQYEQAYRTVLASLQQLEHELPLDRKRRTYVALTVYRLGAVIAKAGRSQEAETTYRQALMMYAELAAEYPDHAAYSRQLAAVHTALGHLQQDQPYEAVQNIGKAIDVCKDLVKARPDDPLHRGALAHSYYILGCTLARTDELHPAEDAFRRAIAIFNEAPTRWDRSAYRAWRPLAEHELGKVLGSVGRTEEAETAHRAAIVLWKQLASQFPDIPLYRHNLANFYVALAKTLVQTGRHDEAAKFGRLAIEAAEKMVSECSDETDLQDQRETVRTFNNLGADLREAGELQGAEQICRKALELAKKLAADAADDSSAQYRLAETHYGLGVVLQRARRYREAADAYRAQLAVCDNLAAAHPADPDYQYHQATAGNYLGIALRSLPRETENALLQHRKAIELMDPLVMKFPDQVRYRSQLVRSHYALGLAHLVAGRRDEAAKSFRLALAASDGTPADRAYGRIQVASVHNDLAWLLSTRPDVKARDPKLAVESARKAVELDPKKGDYWNTLGAAEYRAGNCQETIAALEKAMKLRKGGDSFDWFFLAMAHWRLSNQEDARKWYHQAVEWMEKNQPKNAELRRFHAEASNILEIAEEKR